MKFGKLFKKMQTMLDINIYELSSNRFSKLTYKELRSIAKALYAADKLKTNYTILPYAKLASVVFNTVKDA